MQCHSLRHSQSSLSPSQLSSSTWGAPLLISIWRSKSDGAAQSSHRGVSRVLSASARLGRRTQHRPTAHRPDATAGQELQVKLALANRLAAAAALRHGRIRATSMLSLGLCAAPAAIAGLYSRCGRARHRSAGRHAQYYIYNGTGRRQPGRRAALRKDILPQRNV
eukprot:COSAG06_NODE_161_length_21630_cov_19.444661_19_plen_165_part_00